MEMPPYPNVYFSIPWQFLSDPVVFPGKDGVKHGQHGLLVNTGITGLKAVDIL